MQHMQQCAKACVYSKKRARCPNEQQALSYSKIGVNHCEFSYQTSPNAAADSFTMTADTAVQNAENSPHIQFHLPALVVYVLFLIFGIVGAGAYISSQTSNPEIAQMGTEYLRICCIFSFGMSSSSIYEKLLRSTGYSMFSTIARISGAVTNSKEQL